MGDCIMAEKRTIDDIARLAGVSKATVSRVLNHKPDVDPHTRERILRIVEEQGFVPSITASGLAGGRSRLIGVVVPSFTWPFISNIMRGVAEVIGGTEYELVLYSINDSTRQGKKGDVFDHIVTTKLTAGLLVLFPGQAIGPVTRLHKNGFPVVLVDDQKVPPSLPWIGADNRGGAYEAVRHLLRLGHRRIAHIQGPMEYLCSRERYEGYCQALQEEGLTPDPELILEGNFLSADGQVAASKWFTLSAERRPTAIFAGNDLMAYGVIAAAEEHHVQIPGDVALVGFDDLESSAHVRPTLTTIRQPFVEMGQLAIEILLSLLDRSRQATSGMGVWATFSHNGDTSITGGFHSSFPRMSVASDVNAGTQQREQVRIQLETSLVVRASSGLQLSNPITGTV